MDHLGRVLIVDDDLEWREIVAELLQDAGYSVTTAEDGRRGLEMIATSPPTVVMTDIQMPVMDGRALLAQARALDGRLPVIVVSGNPESDDNPFPGAFRVMRKQGTPDQLLEAVAAAMAHRAAQLPLQKLWRAAKERVPLRRRRPSFLEAITSGMNSYFRSTSARFALAATVLVSALLVRRFIKA
jgi:CheY-like chemotaxis protein